MLTSFIFLTLSLWTNFQTTELSHFTANNETTNYCHQLDSNKLNFIPTGGKGQFLEYKYFSLSYSLEHKNPEWVAYSLDEIQRLQADETNAARESNFRLDSRLKGTATHQDYTNSGFDRGHLVAAEDMSFETTAISESFFVTNISPQSPSFNRGIWKVLEDKVRAWAYSEHKVYVVAGGILDKNCKKIGSKGLTIPDKFFKIVMVYEDGNKKAIAFIFDNAKATKTLKEHATSIAEVEKLTGFNFFPDLSETERKELEENFDVNKWSF